MDRVWKRMKDMAREMAERGEPLPQKQAEALIVRFCHEEREECPPQPALRFLASEFVAMVEEHTAA